MLPWERWRIPQVGPSLVPAFINAKKFATSSRRHLDSAYCILWSSTQGGYVGVLFQFRFGRVSYRAAAGPHFRHAKRFATAMRRPGLAASCDAPLQPDQVFPWERWLIPQASRVPLVPASTRNLQPLGGATGRRSEHGLLHFLAFHTRVYPPLWVMGPPAKSFPISLCFNFLDSRKPYGWTPAP